MSSDAQADAKLEFGLLLLLGFLWGVPYALTKISLTSIPPITLVAARVALAALALWMIVFLSAKPLPAMRSVIGKLFVQACVACVIPYTLIAYGQQWVASASAAILNSSTPLFVCLVSVAWTHHEPVTWQRLCGIAIGMAGVVLLTGMSAFTGIAQETEGALAILLATVSSAVSVIYGRRFAGIAPEFVAAGMLTWAAVILVPLALLLETPWMTNPSTASLVALVVNAIAATAFGFVIYFRLIRTIGTMSTASVGYLKPAMGVIIGVVLLQEILTWLHIVGLFAILAGVAAINQNLVLPRALRVNDCVKKP